MCNLYSNTMPLELMLRLFGVQRDHNHLGNQPPLPSVFGEGMTTNPGEPGRSE